MNDVVASPVLDIEVIIPAFNAGPFLAETLVSVYAQSRLPSRITVIDDRSVDDTVQVATAMARQAPPGVEVRVLANRGLQGPSAGRNTALRDAGPALVSFQDADDLMLPHQLLQLTMALQACPDAVLAFGDTEVFGPSAVLQPSVLAASGVAALQVTEPVPGVFDLGDQAFATLARTAPFGTSACLARREHVREAGLFDESMMFCEDMDLFLRLSLLGRMVFVCERISRKRVHGDNLTHPRNQLKFERGKVLLLAKMLGRWPGRPATLKALTGGQRSLLEQRLASALQGYLYHASRAPVREAVAALRLCRDLGRTTDALAWRHLARFLLARAAT